MITCLGKSCSFCLLGMPTVKVYQFVCVFPPISFEGEMWDLIFLPMRQSLFYF